MWEIESKISDELKWIAHRLIAIREVVKRELAADSGNGCKTAAALSELLRRVRETEVLVGEMRHAVDRVDVVAARECGESRISDWDWKRLEVYHPGFEDLGA